MSQILFPYFGQTTALQTFSDTLNGWTPVCAALKKTDFDPLKIQKKIQEKIDKRYIFLVWTLQCFQMQILNLELETSEVYLLLCKAEGNINGGFPLLL